MQMKKIAFSFIAAAITLHVAAQQRPTVPPTTGGTPPTTGGVPGFPGAGSQQRTGPKSYKEVITDKAKTQKGLFWVHKVEDKFYFEIPNGTLGKDVMAITRFSKVAGGGGNYGGEQANQQTLRWEKGPSANVFLRVITLINVADSTNDIFKAVTNSNVYPIAAAFPIAAYGKDSASVVIDVTDFFKGDNQVVSLPAFAKRRFSLSSVAPDRSYIDKITTFPINTEVRTVKTFNASPAIPGQGQGGGSLPAADAAGVVTLELNTSFIALPEKPAARRLFDNRVGFFADDYVVFGDDQQKVENDVFIVRWRLEPKPEDVEKYKRGELVEPKKPIVYYIDPATPKKWRSYLKKGVDDWQVAFEKAGFKNAIRGEYWPENDSTMSLEDARFSAIRYFASDIQNAYGPNVHDPRTGEIIESHIGWYHNVMELLHNWYMVQTAAVNPRARKMKFDDDLMGELIRFVSSHEVGHTLGLRHNMGSSSKTPVEKLRDKNWVEANGHTASIMDYARFNYVAQPEDNISEKGLFPRIGDYDKWAIEWGYRWLDVKDAEEDKKINNKWIIDRLAQNPRLWFGTETNPFDPRSQTEDLGDNSMKASEYGIKNLKVILKGLPEWTKEEADRYGNLADMYSQITGQFNRYVNHVIKNIGGIYETPKSVEQTGDVYESTPKAIQKEAVAFVNKHVFETPTWLFDKTILNKIANPTGNETVMTIQTNALNNVLNASRLNRMLISANRFGASTYSVDELMEDVKKGLWSELATKKAIDPMRRNLQKAFIDGLASIANPSTPNTAGLPPQFAAQVVNVKNTDLPSIAKAYLRTLQAEVNAAIPGTTDKMSKYHLQDVAQRIKDALNPNKN